MTSQDVSRRARLLVNRDALMNASSKEVGKLAVMLFDRIQLHPVKEEQLLALAAAFLLMAETMKVNPQEAFTAVKNLMVDKLRDDRLKHSFAALQFHIEKELLR